MGVSPTGTSERELPRVTASGLLTVGDQWPRMTDDDVTVDVEVEVEVDRDELEIEVGDAANAEAELEAEGIELEVDVDVEIADEAPEPTSAGIDHESEGTDEETELTDGVEQEYAELHVEGADPEETTDAPADETPTEPPEHTTEELGELAATGSPEKAGDSRGRGDEE